MIRSVGAAVAHVVVEVLASCDVVTLLLDDFRHHTLFALLSSGGTLLGLGFLGHQLLIRSRSAVPQCWQPQLW